MDLFTLMHDTAGPVATIKGAVRLLQSGQLSADESAKLLQAISDRADGLNAVLDGYWNDIKDESDPQWQALWQEFSQTPEFKSIHKHNVAASYLKWLQTKCHRPFKK